MQLVKIQKKTNGKIDQAKVILSIFCLLSGINLSDTELTVLAYFLVYKINQTTKELILKSQVLKSEDSLKNTISKLKKFGLLRKSSTSREYLLNESVSIPLEPVIGFLIKIDNN